MAPTLALPWMPGETSATHWASVLDQPWNTKVGFNDSCDSSKRSGPKSTCWLSFYFLGVGRIFVLFNLWCLSWPFTTMLNHVHWNYVWLSSRIKSRVEHSQMCFICDGTLNVSACLKISEHWVPGLLVNRHHLIKLPNSTNLWWCPGGGPYATNLKT